MKRLLIMALAVGSPVASQAQQVAIDTVFTNDARVVVNAVTSALMQRGVLPPGTEGPIATALMGVLDSRNTGGIRSNSTPVDSAGLASLVQPGARGYIGSVGGRYVIDVIISRLDAAQTRVRIVPLFIAIVPESDGPLGGRPLPSAGLIERQILDGIRSQLPGN